MEGFRALWVDPGLRPDMSGPADRCKNLTANFSCPVSGSRAAQLPDQILQAATARAVTLCTEG